MKFNNYDTLSHLVLGYLLLVCILYAFNLEYDNKLTVPYLACAFLIGYILNALSSLLEPIYYWTIKGMPSDSLLTIKEGKNYTGIEKVKFYQAKDAIEALKMDAHDPNASTGKMFGIAMRNSNGNGDSRVPDFNAQYAFSREVLTLSIIATILLIIKYPCCFMSYLIILVDILLWNRFRERGYYYAREVLNEYLKEKDRRHKKSD